MYIRRIETLNIKTMIELKVNPNEKNGNISSIKIFTDINEVTRDVIEEHLHNVVVAPYFAIVGIISKCSLFEILNGNKRKDGEVVSIVPILAREAHGIDENETFVTDKMPISTKIIIAPTELARGYHITTPKNVNSPIKTAQLIVSDKELLDDCVRGTIWSKLNQTIIDPSIVKSTPKYNNSSKFIFIDYKVVPVNSIIGGYLE